MSDPRVNASAASPWRNRIVGHGEEPPEQLLANPQNWRIHPAEQQQLLEPVLQTVGLVQQIIVNTRTQHIVDGHLRVMLALRHDVPTLPVVYVDLTPEEEQLILASFDTVGGKAVTDRAQIEALLDDVRDNFAPLAQQLAEALDLGSMPDPGGSPASGLPPQLLDVSIEEPRHQVRLGDRWSLGPHLMICVDPIAGWPEFVGQLQDRENDRLCIYPGPLVALTYAGQKFRLVLVQPDPYIAGHILDRWEDAHAEDRARWPLHLNPSPVEQAPADDDDRPVVAVSRTGKRKKKKKGKA
jgi:hypothetical protein